jgi:hypothetical protein
LPVKQFFRTPRLAWTRPGILNKAWRRPQRNEVSKTVPTAFGPSASVEFPVIKDWLEIETGISPLFRRGQTEWQADLPFKKPFTINEHVEFMIGAGPQLSYATAGGGTQVASEIALEWMVWPTKDRKFGWFVEPTYSYSFSKGHEQSLGVTTGLTIAIP